MKTRTILIAALPLAMMMMGTTVRAEEPVVDTMEIVREALRADKKALVASNLTLTEAQAKDFWPIYDRYQKELFEIQSRLFEVIAEYAATHEKISDETAKNLMERYLSIEEERAKVRRSYVDEFSKVVAGRTLARFYQIENKISAVVRFEAAAEIPLIVEE